MIFSAILSWLVPSLGIPLLACGAYLGWWAPAPAITVAFLISFLRPRNGKGLIRRALSSLLMVPPLFALGLLGSALVFDFMAPALRLSLVFLLWAGTGAWVTLSLRNPRRLRVLHLPPAQTVSPTTLLGVTLLCLAPFFSRSGSALNAHELLKENLNNRGYAVQGPVFELTAAPRGLAALFRPSRHLVRASNHSEPSEILLVRLRHNTLGAPINLAGVFNLTRTAAIDETRLNVEGSWAAWQVGAEKELTQIEVVNLAGEPQGAGRGWGFRGELQRAVTNLQETGQRAGVGRTTARLPTSPPGTFALKQGVFEVNAGGSRARWPLGAALESAELAGIVELEPLPPARPGSLSTWAVDRVRAIPWIGSDGLQWIKAMVFNVTSRVEDFRQELAPDDPQAAVDDELGDVWSRLPVLQESEISDWPPAPLTPKLKQALPGEGAWIDMSFEPAFSGLSTRGMVFTFIRVDPKRPQNQVSIALWDARRIALHIVAGTEEPRSTLGQRGSGEIPREPRVMKRLVAAFNGGFQAVHGEFGMMENRVVQLPPKPWAATISAHDDGTARLGTWPGAPTPIPKDMVALRQNMTPLVANGAPNPYRRHWWGGVPEGWTDDSRTVRSALCRTKQGFMAYFYSPGIDPEQLIDALMIAQCEYGVHLDMNGGHAGFELYRAGLEADLPRLTRAMDPIWEASGNVPDMPGYKFNARLLVRRMPLMNFPRYVQTTPRDFFYLTERTLLPGAPAVLETPADWKAVAVSQNEYPHAAMATTLSAGQQKEVGVIRLDPKQLTPDEKKAFVGFGIHSPPSVGPSPDPARARLFWTQSAFILSTKEPAGGTELLSTSEEGRLALCVDEDGFLTVFGPFSQRRTTLDFETDCGPIHWINEPGAFALDETAKDSPRTLARRAPRRAEALFPETPIVAPQVWAIPQSKRAPLVTEP